MTHELKIQKQWADAKIAGEKPFEIRRNDRGFQKGDIVHYTVVDPKTGERWHKPSNEITFGGHNCHALEDCDFVITYVREGAGGLEKGYCVYADRPVPRKGDEAGVRDEMLIKPFMQRTEDRLDALEKALLPARPVSAGLGSGATPSNGTKVPLASPSPLADASPKDGHTEGGSVPKSSDGCKDFVGMFDGSCRFARAPLPGTEPLELFCHNKLCPGFGKRCPVERAV